MAIRNVKISNGLPLRLLVIEKSPAISSNLDILRDAFDVLYADNFTSALALALEHHPALLIVNLPLEENDFRLQLKKRMHTSRIPVLIIIGKEEMKDLACVVSGWDDFIQSSFEEAELLLRVRTMLVNRLQFHDRYVNFTPTSGAEQSADGFLKQVKAVIERNLDNNLFCVADLASGVCVSQAKLYRKLILLTGFSPNNYIRHVRLKHAAQLLSSGAANVGEVAWRVGFNSRSYFGKCFKAVHRCAPGKMINNVSSE